MKRLALGNGLVMACLRIWVAMISGLLLAALTALAQEKHGHGHRHSKTPHSEKMSPRSQLKPAEGASVKILSPKPGQVFKGDSVPLEFEFSKGKRGEHVHAYLNGELAGMFKSSKGTLTVVRPGTHILELRVATSDHNTELDATDRVTFTTK